MREGVAGEKIGGRIVDFRNCGAKSGYASVARTADHRAESELREDLGRRCAFRAEAWQERCPEKSREESREQKLKHQLEGFTLHLQSSRA